MEQPQEQLRGFLGQAGPGAVVLWDVGHCGVTAASGLAGIFVGERNLPNIMGWGMLGGLDLVSAGLAGI